MAMTDKTVTISVPADVLEVLDKRAATIKFSRDQFVGALIKASIGIIDPEVGPDPDGMIPITIGFPVGSAQDYQRSAVIMGTTSSALIGLALEHGRKKSVESAIEYAERLEREKPVQH